MNSEYPREIIETYKSVGEIIELMATEICNLRGVNLTEDNIDRIIKEFMEEK